MKRTHTNWSDNSKHSLWLIRRKKLHIDVSLGELFLFVAYWTMIPIPPPPPPPPPDPNFLLVRSRFFISIEWQICLQHYVLNGFEKKKEGWGGYWEWVIEYWFWFCDVLQFFSPDFGALIKLSIFFIYVLLIHDLVAEVTLETDHVDRHANSRILLMIWGRALNFVFFVRI